MFYLDIFKQLALALTTPVIAGVTIDILLFPAVDFFEMQQRAVHFMIDETDIPVASIDDLISLKEAACRAIDLSDIEHLKRLKGYRRERHIQAGRQNILC